MGDITQTSFESYHVSLLHLIHCYICRQNVQLTPINKHGSVLSLVLSSQPPRWYTPGILPGVADTLNGHNTQGRPHFTARENLVGPAPVPDPESIAI